MSVQYTPEERSYYDRLFNVIDKDQLGILTGEACYAFLLTSSLPQATLGTIWSLADSANNGYLTKENWYMACRMIGWAQKGDTPTEEIAKRRGPYPVFQGHTPPPAPASSISAQVTGSQPPSLNAQDKAQFTRLFVGAGPENGLLSSNKAQGIFVKSGLPTETLAKAWNLADTQQRGSLDLTDFIIGMYYLQSLMAGSIKDLPIALPPGLYEQASGGRPKPSGLSGPTSPIARQMTGSPARMPAQLTGSGIMQPQRTGQSLNQQPPARQYTAPPAPSSGFSSAFTPKPAQSAGPAWDVTPEAKAASDRFFDGLDTARKGFIEGDIAVPFLMQSGLPETDLAQVWDLADIRKGGQLTKEEFAVAMFLINNKLAGKELPTALEQSMIPPNLRNSSGPAVPPQNDVTKDLFDIFGDTPPASTPMAPQQSYFASPPSRAPSVNVPPPPQSRAMSPPAVPSRNPAPDAFGSIPFGVQPDLMGDDPVAPAPPTPQPRVDRSAEIGNAQNSLASTQKAVSDLEKERSNLEAENSASAAQLKELELRLSSVRAQHDTETRIVNDLRTRVAEQKEKLTKSRQDLIQNESELSALRAEKDEIEQVLLSDKEEVRSASKRLKEVADETSTLKSLLEKMKKEARQQKGMVAISKKQVTTAEGTRDAVQTEIDQVAASNSQEEEEEILTSPPTASAPSPFGSPFIRPASSQLNTASAIPLPATPQQMLSPVATGGNQRSTNPFERLGFSAKPVERSLSTSSSQAPAAMPEEGMSTIQMATLGAGGLAAAGALAAGSIVGAAVLGTGAAAATVVEHMTHDGRGLTSDKTPPAQHQELESDGEKTPAAREEQADPFGMTEQASPQQTPSAQVASDPFGVPETSQPEAHAAGGFGDGFGDDFAKPFNPSEAPAHTADVPVQEQDHTLPRGMAPSSQTAEDFDEAFNDMQGQAPATNPLSAIRPGLEENDRTFSTQVFAPASTIGTPTTEVVPGTPASIESQVPVPVNVAALQPHVDQERSRDQNDDSSDDEEDDAPEDLDRARSPYDGRATTPSRSETSQIPTSGPAPDSPRQPPQSMIRSESPEPSAYQRSSSPPNAQLQALGLGAPVAITDTRDESFDPFAPQQPAMTSPPSSNSVRRQPPPPPVSQKSMRSESNPFGASSGFDSLAPSSATGGYAAGSASGFAPAPAQTQAQTQGQTQPSASSFDDDFDFDDLPPAQIASSGQSTGYEGANAHSTSRAGPSNDFDDEFDDFTPDFEMVNKPVVVAPPSQIHQPVAEQGPPQLPTFENQPGFGTINPSTSSGFSFEDAFMDRPEQSARNPQRQQEELAPMPSFDTSPPRAAERPALPQRQTAAMTKAQPDDLADVKKLCNMGFDRNLVIDALEGADYNFDKALNFLLPGA